MQPPPPYVTPRQVYRPGGVTVLAVLSFLAGVVWILLGLLLASFFPLAMGLDPATSAVFAICGVLGIGLGVFHFLVGWGLWNLQGWARIATIVLAIIGLLNFPIGTIISIVILVYLFQPEVQAAFAGAPMPGVGVQYPPAYPVYPYPPPVAGYPPAGTPPRDLRPVLRRLRQPCTVRTAAMRCHLGPSTVPTAARSSERERLLRGGRFAAA